MPTDAERYAQLLQNLSVGIGAIRDAAELAFGVMLPSAETLNEEFEGITRAIYAAADRPRPAPVTDDTPTTRTHFVYRIDIWTDDGKDILEHLAGLENLIVARAAFRAARERWPKAGITLRQGDRVLKTAAAAVPNAGDSLPPGLLDEEAIPAADQGGFKRHPMDGPPPPVSTEPRKTTIFKRTGRL